MFAIERDLDNELLRVWQLLHDLSEQLNHNKNLITSLRTQGSSVNLRAAANGPGSSLRRYNTDISKEFFQSELERTAAQTVIENQTLLHENKQLSMLLKEYETTMDVVMTKFRNHAMAAQQHELTMTRHYETLLLSRETATLSSELAANTNIAASLQRLAQNLQMLWNSIEGKDAPEDGEETTEASPDDEPVDNGNWAVQRELEIQRLEQENAELRKLLAVNTESLQTHDIIVSEDDLHDYKPVITHASRAPTHIGEWAIASPVVQPSNGGSEPPMQSLNAAGGVSQGIGASPLSNAGGVQTPAVQRSAEQPGARPVSSIRRPSMFGQQRGRGGWNYPQSPWREFQGNGGNGQLDLGG